MIIGLYSPAPQCGKTSVAHILEQYGFSRTPFADPLKRMACRFLESLGYSEFEAARLVLHDKHELIGEVGVTSRHLLQTLGTEWGRSCVHPEVWIRCWEAQIWQHDRCVVDDLRFVNEYNAIRKRGGQVWLVTRPGIERNTDHASEGALDDAEFDAVIHNDGSLGDLRSKVLALL